MYRKANKAKMILSTLPPWLKAIINARVAEATHHTRTAPTLKELWDFVEQGFHEYDPSRGDEGWRALTPRVVKGQVTLIDLEDFYARWQRLLPLSNETRPHVIREQLLSKLPWIKATVVKQEAKNSQDSYVVDFSGLDPSPGRAQFKKELRKYSAQRCTSVPEIVSFSGPGVIVDCKDPSLQEWILQLNNTPHTRGYTMKVEQRRPRLKPAEIYALAHKSVSEREPLERLNKGDKMTVTYTHRPSHNRTAVNAVNAEATADPNTSEPADTSVNAVGHPKPPKKKPVDPGPKPPPTFGYHVPNIGKHVNKRRWTCLGLIGVPPIPQFGRVSLILRAMTLIGTLQVSLKVVSLRVAIRVAIRVAVVIRVVVVIRVAAAARAIKEAKERRTGADVGRSAQRRPLRKKKPSGTPVHYRGSRSIESHEGAYSD